MSEIQHEPKAPSIPKAGEVLAPNDGFWVNEDAPKSIKGHDEDCPCVNCQ